MKKKIIKWGERRITVEPEHDGYDCCCEGCVLSNEKTACTITQLQWIREGQLAKTCSVNKVIYCEDTLYTDLLKVKELTDEETRKSNIPLH